MVEKDKSQIAFPISSIEKTAWAIEKGIIEKDSAYTPEWFNYFDIACEVFAPLDWRQKKVDMVAIYPSEYTVIAKKETDINSIEDLKGLTGVTGVGTVYEDILINNNVTNFYPDKLNSYIYTILEDKYHRLWIATNTGIVMV